MVMPFMINSKLLKVWYVQTTSGLKSDEPEIPGLASYSNKYTHYGMCEEGNKNYKGRWGCLLNNTWSCGVRQDVDIQGRFNINKPRRVFKYKEKFESDMLCELRAREGLPRHDITVDNAADIGNT
jgi:hypothetical protein